MFLYIKQKNKNFIFRKKTYQTPIEMMFDKDYVSNIVTQLYKQEIDDYTITAISDKSLSLSICNEKKNNETSINIKKPIKDKSDIKDILTELLNDSKKIKSKIEDISSRPVQGNSVVSTTSVKKVKDTADTFIPQIDTKGMGIKTNVKTEKSSNNTASSADVLRQLLKGI